MYLPTNVLFLDERGMRIPLYLSLPQGEKSIAFPLQCLLLYYRYENQQTKEHSMDGKKVVIAIGSPRKEGNCAALAQSATDGIRAAGGEAESFLLHSMNIHPCTACDSCQKDMDTLCVIEDDMQILYPKIMAAQGLIIASPVYWFTVSAQTKLFMDRCYAFGSAHGNGMKGKRIGILLTYGDVDPFISGAVNALRTFQDAFGYIGSPIVGMVYGSALDAGVIRANGEIMNNAFMLGKRMIEALST